MTCCSQIWTVRTWTQEKGTPYISDVFTVLVVCTVEALRQSIYVKFAQFKKWHIEAVALGTLRLIYVFKFFFLPFVPIHTSTRTPYKSGKQGKHTKCWLFLERELLTYEVVGEHDQVRGVGLADGLLDRGGQLSKRADTSTEIQRKIQNVSRNSDFENEYQNEKALVTNDTMHRFKCFTRHHPKSQLYASPPCFDSNFLLDTMLRVWFTFYNGQKAMI